VTWHSGSSAAANCRASFVQCTRHRASLHKRKLSARAKHESPSPEGAVGGVEVLAKQRRCGAVLRYILRKRHDGCAEEERAHGSAPKLGSRQRRETLVNTRSFEDAANCRGSFVQLDKKRVDGTTNGSAPSCRRSSRMSGPAPSPWGLVVLSLFSLIT